MGLDEVTQICPVPLPTWLSDSGGKGIQVVAVVHGEAQLAGRWDDHGRQVVLDTSSVKVFLPGITDTTTLQAASTLCGQASWKVRGQDHATRHDVATPDMIRQLPAGFALVIRGGCAPVIARLPRAWNNPAYRRARRASSPAARRASRQARPAAEPQARHPRRRDRRLARRRRLAPLPVEPTMTADPLTAVLDQLAAHREQLIGQLDAREAAHFAAVGEQLTQLAAVITTIGRTLADDTAALARLEALDRQVTELAARLAGPAPTARTVATSPARRRLVDAHPRRTQEPADRRAAGLGRAGVPARLRPPGRHPRPLLASPRPVPVRAGHPQPAVVGALPPARPQHRQAAVRPGRIPGPHPARPRRPADDRNHRLRPRPARRHRRLHPEHAMTNPALRQALAYADRGWPVFPCRPARRSRPPGTATSTPPPTRSRSPSGSAARPAGTWPSPPAPPDPTSSTSTSTAPPGTGSPPSPGSAPPGCWRAPAATSAPPAAACTSTSPARPSATATCPRSTWTSGPQAATSWPRPRRSAASPISAIRTLDGQAGLDWQAVIRLLEPAPPVPAASRPARFPDYGITRLARWVAAQREGNRNAGLFWAANRALEADPAADLSPLAAAARQAGLPEPEITRTLNSARRTGHVRPEPA